MTISRSRSIANFARVSSNVTSGGTSGDGGASVTTSDTAPENPTDGDMWFNTELLELYLYYDDGATSQWVSASQPGPQGPAGSGGESGGGATTYANYAAFPISGNTTGDFAIALDTKALYMWDGTEWDRIISGPNENPEWVTVPNSYYALEMDGTPSIISVEASDPEGFPITYSHSTNPSNQTQAIITNNNDGTFTLTPSTNSIDAGNFTLRVVATDGVTVSIPKYSTIALSFGIGNVTGIKVTQTSTIYGNTGWGMVALGDLGSGDQNIFDNTTLASQLTMTSGAWASGLYNTTIASGYMNAWFATKAAQFGVTLSSTYKKASYASGGSVVVDVNWTTPLTMKQILISGDETNGYDYWNGGYVQFYINGVLDTTQYTMTNETPSSPNTYRDFTA